MIKVHKNDSIVDIIIKIKNNKEKELVLEFPFWHPILHNYTSLKILKNKAEKRDLIIITNDKTAKKIGKTIWIKYSIIDDPDIVEYNYSFFEYLWYTFRNYFREIKDLIFWLGEKGIIWKYNKNQQESKIWYFITLLFVSILLLIFIFYFAVNKTYIYITPKIEVKTKAKNFVFTEMDEWDFIVPDNVIRLKKIEKTITINENFWTSWISDDTVSTSRWKITLFNNLEQKIDLLDNTRVQTGSGVIFFIEWSISIPAAEHWSWWIIPWTVDVYAKSRNLDIDWKVVWSRWNIKTWTHLFLPGLKENKENIYANAISDFSWWNDNYKKVLTENDIENAKILLKWKIEWEILKSVKEDIDEENKINDAQYEILWINDIIKYSDFEVYWIDNYEIWQEIDKFNLSATIKISTYSYNKWLLISKMRQDINNTILSDVEEIMELNSNSLRITNILSKTEKPFSVKATAILEAYVIHNFLSKNNTYVERLKHVVAWLPKEEAEKVLLNNNKINNVKIETKPFFINNISKINDNIILRVTKN